jgi:hypothetical protein
MIIRIMYADYSYDYVDTNMLDRLIASKRIIKFVRPSEDAWIDVNRDPIRGSGNNYAGPERRLVRAGQS